MASKKKSFSRKVGRERTKKNDGNGSVRTPQQTVPTTAGAEEEIQAPAGEAREQALNPENRSGFPVVGVGASAGGVEAFTDLLAHLPSDPGVALVLVQHLSPVHVSILAEILGRVSSTPVNEVKDGMPVEVNHVYVIPPNTDLAIQHGVLHLMPRVDVPGHQRLPIDYFFRSLAEDLGTRAIGVILSGTASDGALGLKAIKAEGGITIAQDERTAKYDGMPRSAIAAGYVDFVLSPEEIAAELVRIGKHLYPMMERFEGTVPSLPEEDGTFSKILVLLRSTTGVDFTYYKLATIRRRVQRRMLLQKVRDQLAYLKLLQADPHEVWNLYNDILISVTGFFRDRESFEALSQVVFPRLLEGRSADDPIRIWVPGCSTGEEPYSIAMCLLEYLGDKGPHMSIQIFATDISELALEKARLGVYPEGISADVSAERLRRFFTKTDGGYQIKKSIRDLCIYAKHNLYKDPPFSRLDLISCRNVMIYLGSVLHKKIFPVFFYALKRNGMLFLGSSETIGAFSNLFSQADKKHKLYRKKTSTTPQPMAFEAGELTPERIRGAHRIPSRAWQEFDLQKEAEHLLLASYAPDGVILNADFEILHFRGKTGDFLEPAAGEASLNVLKMAREGLLFDLRTALLKAKREESAVRREGLTIRNDGKSRHINLNVIPIREKTRGDHYYLVLFEPVPQPATPVKEQTGTRPVGEKVSRKEALEITHLKQELAATKEYLESIIEEQEATNEELRSANEEIQSSNEELQSTNEELETAKEELQSTNEELNTVNEALENRNEELTQLNDDLLNLLTCVHIPVIMLGNDMRIRRYTPAAERVLSVVPSDIGRRYFDIRHAVEVPDLDELIHHVIETLESVEREVRDVYGAWYTMRVRPYKTAENRIDGVVLAFYDIEEQKRIGELLRQQTDLAARLLRLVPDPTVILAKDRRVVHANAPFGRKFNLQPRQLEGRPLQETGEVGWNIAEMQRLLDQPGDAGGDPVGKEISLVGPDGKEHILTVFVHAMGRDGGNPEFFVLVFKEDR